jgi:hypothetical protein
VPLRADDIHRCLIAVRERIAPQTRLHLLGFAKAEQIDDFVKHRIESFDSISPLLRAFKDARSNYYVLTEKGLDYYAAVPQALENVRLVRAATAYLPALPPNDTVGALLRPNLPPQYQHLVELLAATRINHAIRAHARVWV